VIDVQWLPPTRANIAKTLVTITLSAAGSPSAHYFADHKACLQTTAGRTSNLLAEGVGQSVRQQRAAASPAAGNLPDYIPDGPAMS
jgi:hypothetical protein